MNFSNPKMDTKNLTSETSERISFMKGDVIREFAYFGVSCSDTFDFFKKREEHKSERIEVAHIH